MSETTPGPPPANAETAALPAQAHEKDFRIHWERDIRKRCVESGVAESSIQRIIDDFPNILKRYVANEAELRQMKARMSDEQKAVAKARKEAFKRARERFEQGKREQKELEPYRGLLSEQSVLDEILFGVNLETATFRKNIEETDKTYKKQQQKAAESLAEDVAKRVAPLAADLIEYRAAPGSTNERKFRSLMLNPRYAEMKVKKLCGEFKFFKSSVYRWRKRLDIKTDDTSQTTSTLKPGFILTHEGQNGERWSTPEAEHRDPEPQENRPKKGGKFSK